MFLWKIDWRQWRFFNRENSGYHCILHWWIHISASVLILLHKIAARGPLTTMPGRYTGCSSSAKEIIFIFESMKMIEIITVITDDYNFDITHWFTARVRGLGGNWGFKAVLALILCIFGGMISVIPRSAGHITWIEVFQLKTGKNCFQVVHTVPAICPNAVTT